VINIASFILSQILRHLGGVADVGLGLELPQHILLRLGQSLNRINKLFVVLRSDVSASCEFFELFIRVFDAFVFAHDCLDWFGQQLIMLL